MRRFFALIAARTHGVASTLTSQGYHGINSVFSSWIVPSFGMPPPAHNYAHTHVYVRRTVRPR
jgi:hypothetical protein